MSRTPATFVISGLNRSTFVSFNPHPLFLTEDQEKCYVKKEDQNLSYTVRVYVCVLVTQLCPTLYDPMDYSLPGSSVHGILQARILGWVAIPFSREFSQPRDQTWVSHIAGRFFTVWATREAHTWYHIIYSLKRVEKY